MSGMINAAQPADAATPDANQLTTPILAAAERKIETQLDPGNRENYMRIVVAGMRAGLARGPDGILAHLRKSPDPVRDAARGAVNLALLLRRETKQGVMPLKAMVPAALTLMLHALDFVARTKLATVDNAALVRATHVFTNTLFQKLGITPAMLQKASAQVHATVQDPVAFDAIRRKLGSVVAPGASVTTSMPATAPVTGNPS
jgi:hypothetical protein